MSIPFSMHKVAYVCLKEWKDISRILVLLSILLNLYCNALGSVGFDFPERIYLSGLSLYSFSKTTINDGIYTFLIDDSVLGGSITTFVLPLPSDILSTVFVTERNSFFNSMSFHWSPQISPTLNPVYKLNKMHRLGSVSLLSKNDSSSFRSFWDKTWISFFLLWKALGYRICFLVEIHCEQI